MSLACGLLAGLATASDSVAQPPAKDPLVRIQHHGETLWGIPLVRTPEFVLLLQRDGSLRDFQPTAELKVEPVDRPFEPLGMVELRAQLLTEFGSRMTVSTTPYYVVVHPPSGEHWVAEFDRLHRQYLQFFATRGFPLRQSRFPMVAVVLPDRRAFERYARADGVEIGGSIVGYYSKRTNRIALYAGIGSEMMPTIRHEAAHQSAYNTGLHSRIGTMPLWVVEGLGVLFESEEPARDASDGGLGLVRERCPDANRIAACIEQLFASDDLFQSDPPLAYALSGCMTKQLVRTRSPAYVAYLRKLAARGQIERPGPSQRSQDFDKAFDLSPGELARELDQGPTGTP
jgi:hypothetical protein